MKKIWQHPVTFVSVALIAALLGFFFGQRFDQIGRFGDDKYYVLMAAGMDKLLFDVGINDYRLQRIVPPGLVHATMKLFQRPINIPNIRFIWSMYNIFLSGLIGLLWVLIARRLKISTAGQWLGMAAIFGSYHMLKYIPFISVSTDLFAFTITFALVYFYLRNWWIGLCALMVVGAFCWPTIVYTSLALLLFPRDTPEQENTEAKAPYFLNYVLALAIVLPLAIYAIQTVYPALQGERIYQMGVFSMGANRPMMNVLSLSMGAMLLYLFAALSFLFDNVKWFRWPYLKNQFHLVRVLVGIVLLVAIKMVIFWVASAHDSRPVMYLITNLIIVGTLTPLAFLVSHPLFFGPVFLFFPLMWKQVCRVIHKQGMGLLICTLLIVLFSIDSESRKQMNTYPLLLPFLIKAVDRLKWNKFHYIGLGLMMLAASKVWYHINPTGWGSAMDFPAQSFYMTMGPWMAHSMYAVQGACVLGAALLLYFGYVYKRQDTRDNNQTIPKGKITNI